MVNLLPSGSWADNAGDVVTGAAGDAAGSDSVQWGVEVLNTAQRYPDKSPQWLRENGYPDAAAYRAAQQEGPNGPIEALIDIPADAVNASLGTGKNLGWFGEIDRHLDYRAITGEVDPDDEGAWADVNEATTGLSGAWNATAGQTAAAGEDASKAAQDIIFSNKLTMAVAALAVIYVVGQLVDVQAGGA